VIGALKSGDKIEIRRLRVLPHPPAQLPHWGNPKTGERVEVPAKKVPYFKPSKELRDLVIRRSQSVMGGGFSQVYSASCPALSLFEVEPVSGFRVSNMAPKKSPFFAGRAFAAPCLDR